MAFSAPPIASYPTLKVFLRAFASEQACKAHLGRLLSSSREGCLHRGSRDLADGVSAATSRGWAPYRCRTCGYRFRPTVGTIFHHTHLDRRQWFLAIYLMGSGEKGISAVQLKTYLGVNYETARKMAKRIRQAIEQDKHLVQRFLEIPAPEDRFEPPIAKRGRHPTLPAVVFKFQDDERCRAFLERIRWAEGPFCLRCKGIEVGKIQSRSGRIATRFRCRTCKYQFNVITDTALRRTHRLSEWLIAIYLMLASPKPLPAKQLERLLGVNYRTAREMVRLLGNRSVRVRELLKRYISYNDPKEWNC